MTQIRTHCTLEYIFFRSYFKKTPERSIKDAVSCRRGRRRRRRRRRMRRTTEKVFLNQLKISEIVKHEIKYFYIKKKNKQLSYGYENPFEKSKI